MALLISHGLPKSGSTFLFQIARDVAATINGMSHIEAKSAFFPDLDVPDFVPQPTDEIVAPLIERLPPGAAFVIKTHGALTPLLKAAIGAGEVKAMVSFRDPRDTIISMLDAGERDRRRGADRLFGKLFKVEDAIGPARHGWRVAREWIGSEGVLPIPYYLTATDQNIVIRKICDYMDAGSAFDEIFPRYEDNKTTRITEYNKGVANRFLDDLPREDTIALTSTLSHILREYDALTRQWMDNYGYAALYETLLQDRQQRLEALIGSG